eukprot:TRINITY_DN18411_c0_g5_i1.p1 TRINITY_DN18411_c0_g5~~TRINITY_DN18411_c0_g5_i1.p1  ORF type:complete len:667 (+),score=91.54 TRINITY_DN18411_c0_g5_i1:161-2161(+)
MTSRRVSFPSEREDATVDGDTPPPSDQDGCGDRGKRFSCNNTASRSSEKVAGTVSAVSSARSVASKKSRYFQPRPSSRNSRMSLNLVPHIRVHESLRQRARKILKHPVFEFLQGFVVMVDFVAICRDTDSKAANGDKTRGEEELITAITMNVCFSFYVFDLATRLLAFGCRIFRLKHHLLDAFVIGVSIFEAVIEFVQSASGGSSLLMIRMIRLCRLLRLVRVIKLFSGMKELRRLTQMIATCGRTMFWSFLMAFLVMSMWSVAAVELLHPVAEKLADQGTWEGCERCDRAFRSVLHSNLTFFQIIVAGDSWGYLAVPIIEEAPGTAIVFCGAVLTLTFGIMQLITAVIVDTFADLRKMDVNALAEEMEVEEKEEKDFLDKMFRDIDLDGSGAVTWAELAEGALKVKDFRDWLRVMDIDQHDFELLFNILDTNHSGQIDVDEFVDVLYRMRNAESKTTGKLVKHMIDNLEKTVKELLRRVDVLHERFERLEPSELYTREARSSSVSSVSLKDADLAMLQTSIHQACLVALEASQKAAVDEMEQMVRDDRNQEAARCLEAWDTSELWKTEPTKLPAGFSNGSNGLHKWPSELRSTAASQLPVENRKGTEATPARPQEVGDHRDEYDPREPFYNIQKNGNVAGECDAAVLWEGAMFSAEEGDSGSRSS